MPESGWVTNVSFYAAGYDGVTTDFRIGLYDNDLTRVHAGPSRSMGPTFAWRSESGLERRFYKGDAVWAAFWAQQDHSLYRTSSGSYRQVRTNLPATLDSAATYPYGQIAFYVDYVANVAPLKGAILSPEAGSLTNQQPTIRFTATHPAADSAYDYSTKLNVIVTRVSDNAVVYNETTDFPARAADGSAQATLIRALEGGVNYTVSFRHADSWGVYSPPSDPVAFTTSLGPDRPTTEAPSGKINVFSGYSYTGHYTHPNGLSSNAIEVELWNQTSTTRILTSGIVAKTVAHDTDWSFAENHADLTWGTNYTWRVRFRDSVGNWGGFSAFRSFKTNSKPNAPTNLYPASGVRRSDRVFSMSISDPDNDVLTDAYMELINATTGVLVRNSPAWAGFATRAAGDEVVPTTANGHKYVALNSGKSGSVQPTFPLGAGATVRDNAGMVAVARSTAYTLGAIRLKPGGTSADAEYYEVTTAGTTAVSAPAYPTTDGSTVTDGSVVFTTRKTVVWQEAGSDALRPMAISPDGKTATLTLPASAMTLNTPYRWRGVASDGVLLGAYSGYASFTYAEAPIIELLSPIPLRVNSARNPSVEYESPLWTMNGSDADNVLQRLQTLEAAYGDWVYQAASTGASSVVSSLAPVDSTRPGIYALEAMRELVNAAFGSAVEVLCYDAQSILLGSVVPSGFGSVQAGELPAAWTRFGGIVWPVGSANSPAYPTGTAFTQIKVTPATEPTTVRIDGIQRETLSPMSLAEWEATKDWYGYFDGGFGTGYSWAADPGNSDSNGIPVLTTTDTDILISYYSAVSQVKKDDRLIVERLVAGEWKRVYDSGKVASTRTLIPLPRGVVKNQVRHRFMVEVNDAVNTLGSTPWVEFDVRYAGARELPIISAVARPERGEIEVLHQRTLESEDVFAGVEFARESLDEKEPFAIVGYNPDPSSTSQVYSYPVSGREYAFYVRQVIYLGVERIEGRWRRIDASVDYEGLYFVKDTEHPTEKLVAFAWPQSKPPRVSPGAEGTTVPLRGRQYPGHYSYDYRTLQASVSMWLHDKGKYAVEPAEHRHSVLEEIINERPAICVMYSIPKFKVFAKIVGDADIGVLAFGPIRDPNFSYEATNFSEDVYERGGF